MKKIILNVRLTKEEREVVLNFDNITEKWTMETTIAKYFNHAVNKGWKVLKEYYYDDGVLVGGLLEAPETGITIHKINYGS